MSNANVSAAVMASMFKHLTSTYSPDEAREILVQKYPDAKSDIESFEVTSPAADAIEAIETETKKLARAVKQKVAKVAKPKAEKVSKPRAESKIKKAIAIYSAAEDQSRQAIVEVFVRDLELSESVAASYFYTVKRTLKNA